MLFDFFPSRQLTWYLAKTFAVRIVAVLGMLVLVLLMLDLLGETGDILAAPGNGEPELLRLCLAAPAAVDRAVPALFGAAGDDHHAGGDECQFRGGGDEGGGAFRTPDPRAPACLPRWWWPWRASPSTNGW